MAGSADHRHVRRHRACLTLPLNGHQTRGAARARQTFRRPRAPPGRRRTPPAATRRGRRTQVKILHLEDNSTDAELVREILAAEFSGCAITVVQSREPFLAGLAADPAPDLIISDFSLPSFDGPAALALVRERTPGIPFIFLSGSIAEEHAISPIPPRPYPSLPTPHLPPPPPAL